jgi:hypothetical protein
MDPDTEPCMDMLTKLQAPRKFSKLVLAFGQAFCTSRKLLNLLSQRLHSTFSVEHRHEVFVIACK